jgi:hypothetical protein
MLQARRLAGEIVKVEFGRQRPKFAFSAKVVYLRSHGGGERASAEAAATLWPRLHNRVIVTVEYGDFEGFGGALNGSFLFGRRKA